MMYSKTVHNGMITITGVPASPGIVIGKSYCYLKKIIKVDKSSILKNAIPQEIVRLEHAIERSEYELKKIISFAANQVGKTEIKIFEAQILILQDIILLEGIKSRIKNELTNAEAVVDSEFSKYQSIMLNAKDEYLRERAHEVEDIKNRIIRNIQQEKLTSRIDKNVIVVSEALTAGDTILFSRNKILGFATDGGGITSHSTLLARSLQLPAVVGLKDITKNINHGDLLIVDGYDGIVIIRPNEETIEKFNREKTRHDNFEKKLIPLRDQPATTLDNHTVSLTVNIEFMDEIPIMLKQGAQGVGLYRSEGVLIGRDSIPTEDEQFTEYDKLASAVAPHRIVIRTFDIGGDKIFSEQNDEENPSLGWRGIRISLDMPELFKTQLRAILRASTRNNVDVLFPMVSGFEEIIEAKKYLSEIKDELQNKNIPFDKNIRVGSVIEIPSAALLAGDLARELDFLSIGTNDLLQFVLAVDRNNERVSKLFNRFNPGLLRLISQIITQTKSENKKIAMCGEMAGDPLATTLLIGLGLDEFSVIPDILPEIKKIIRTITLKDAKEIAKHALTLSTSAEIQNYLQDELQKIIPDIPLSH
ncbi:MAG: phosphoenolpyruvate--protein phosphotransferase [Ignavibacteria bacterium]|nr:phosphoenolpyruvate--protein phosphotransferase [Bacteroidota bacterium]MSQ45901.1 phosphoenolpyruvate--protein phosphotransferase [Ignavibacteria bacterium]